MSLQADEPSRKALVAWSKMVLPRSCRGLDLKDLFSWNRAAIMKHLWRIDTKKESLWIKWVHMYFIKSQSCFSCLVPKTFTWYSKMMLALRYMVNGDQH